MKKFILSICIGTFFGLISLIIMTLFGASEYYKGFATAFGIFISIDIYHIYYKKNNQ